MTDSTPLRHPGVKFPPPLILVAGLALGWLADRYLAAWPMSPLTGTGIRTAGAVLAIAGLALSLWGAITFRMAHTAVIPHYPASRLVRTGPYRFTRNPMYLGFSIAYAGVAALLDSWWPILLLPVAIALLWRLVIRREEAYLASAFGEEYAEFRARVRRWL